MNWCQKRTDPNAECGHDLDKPLACHPADSGKLPDHEGAFEFVQLRSKPPFVAETQVIVNKLILRFDESIPMETRKSIVEDIKFRLGQLKEGKQS
jgi:hypothetical protein